MSLFGGKGPALNPMSSGISQPRHFPRSFHKPSEDFHPFPQPPSRSLLSVKSPINFSCLHSSDPIVWCLLSKRSTLPGVHLPVSWQERDPKQETKTSWGSLPSFPSHESYSTDWLWFRPSVGISYAGFIFIIVFVRRAGMVLLWWQEYKVCSGMYFLQVYWILSTLLALHFFCACPLLVRVCFLLIPGFIMDIHIYCYKS